VLHSPKDTSDTSGDTASTWVAPENSWPSAEPPANLRASGFQKNDVPSDFRLMDQFGDTVALWQFYGSVIALDFSTGWCGPCAELARGAEEIYQEYKDEGVMYLTVMPENGRGDVPSQSDLAAWANAFGLSSPVLSDGAGYTAQVVPDAVYPKILILDREMRVVNAGVSPATDAAVASAIADAL
jgi:thiol-disulfide isomerase/thioredoxin